MRGTIPTIRDVARACGVSAMTVSFVLNNRQGEVSEETRERVLRTMREMGYRPPTRRSSVEREICTLGVVAGVAGDSLMQPGYYSSIIQSVLLAADHLKQNVTLFTHSLMHDDTHTSLRVYCDGRCEGLMVVAPTIGNPLVKALQERGIPFVVIGDSAEENGFFSVDMDNVRESVLLTEYLIRQGHRRIGFVGGPEFVRSSKQRQHGFRLAMEKHGLIVNERHIVSFNLYESELTEGVLAMMRVPEEERPTALFCWNDGTASITMQTIRRLHLAMPEQVSIVGIDDAAASAASEPPLTTLRQPYREIGRRAVELLLSQIRQSDTTPHCEYVPGQLVVRDSVIPRQNKTGQD